MVLHLLESEGDATCVIHGVTRHGLLEAGLTQLRLIELMGLQNYLQSQTAEPNIVGAAH